MDAEMAPGLLLRARRLTRQERRLLSAAWLTLAVAPLALALVPFRRLRDWAEGETTSRRRAGTATPERVAALVEAAARHHLVRTTCLARALVLCRLLRRRGEAARLVIGGTWRGGTKVPGAFEAHAWVACEDLALTAGGPIDRFEILIGGGVSGEERRRSPLT
jgi:Transglutaminase-like superfamily